MRNPRNRYVHAPRNGKGLARHVDTGTRLFLTFAQDAFNLRFGHAIVDLVVVVLADAFATTCKGQEASSRAQDRHELQAR